MLAIAQQQQKKKQEEVQAPVERVSVPPAENEDLNDQDDSGSSSSYKSPEIDSDELAALGNDNLV